MGKLADIRELSYRSHLVPASRILHAHTGAAFTKRKYGDSPLMGAVWRIVSGNSAELSHSEAQKLIFLQISPVRMEEIPMGRREAGSSGLVVRWMAVYPGGVVCQSWPCWRKESEGKGCREVELLPFLICFLRFLRETLEKGNELNPQFLVAR